MARHKKSQIENEPTKIQITLGEIPNEFGRRVSHLVSTYSTYLVGLRQPDFYRHFGSGTFVQSSGRHYVLTAGHCAHRLKEDRCEEIGLSSIEGRSSRFRIPLLPPVIVDPPKRFGELGPDLAFLPIPPSKVGTIAAYNSFINLDVRRETMPQRKPKSGRRLWAVVGAPESKVALVDNHRFEFGVGVHFCSVEKQYETDGYDYLEIVPWGVEKPTTSYKGVSGGGLWQIDVGRSADGRFDMGPPSLNPPSLEGCAFYESVATDGHLFIRCHGRRSIYEHGVAALG